MKRLMLAGLLLQAACQAQASDVLRVYNWNLYIEPQVIREFERQYGARVDYQTYTTPQELDDALARGETWDVIVPLHYQLKAMQMRQQLQPLNLAQLPNRQFVDPALGAMLAGFDKQSSDYAIPYMWGSVGLLLNPQQTEQALGEPAAASWRLLFDPEQSGRLQACGISLLDTPDEVLSLAMNYRGRTLGQSTPRQIQRQTQALQPLLDKARMVDDRQYFQAIAAGRLCIGMAWLGHALSALDANPALRYVIPEEGSLMYIDSLAIPANAPNAALAHRFIDFLLAPSNAVRNSLAARAYSSLDAQHPAARELASTAPNLVPSSRQRRQLHLLENLSDKQKAAINQAWAELRKP
ncbi:extracellular solute-binding protein [Pseudomonas sp. GW6]